MPMVQPLFRTPVALLSITALLIGCGGSMGRSRGPEVSSPFTEDDSRFFENGVSFVTTPESLVRVWIDQLDDLAVARANGSPVKIGDATMPVFVDAEGRDLQQLIQKFLFGAVAYSQAVDDYLDDVRRSSLLMAAVAGQVQVGEKRNRDGRNGRAGDGTATPGLVTPSSSFLVGSIDPAIVAVAAQEDEENGEHEVGDDAKIQSG